MVCKTVVVLSISQQVFGISVRKKQRDDKIKSILRENEDLKDQNLKLNFEISKLKKDMAKVCICMVNGAISMLHVVYVHWRYISYWAYNIVCNVKGNIPALPYFCVLFMSHILILCNLFIAIYRCVCSIYK